jgi:hypothetical protein
VAGISRDDLFAFDQPLPVEDKIKAALAAAVLTVTAIAVGLEDLAGFSATADCFGAAGAGAEPIASARKLRSATGRGAFIVGSARDRKTARGSALTGGNQETVFRRPKNSYAIPGSNHDTASRELA